MLRLSQITLSVLFCFVSVLSSQERVENEEAKRAWIMVCACGALGKGEETGRNDGVFVDEVLETVGLGGTGSPWCAAFNRWVYDQAGLRNVGPRSAWAPDWVRHPTWKRGRGVEPKSGDAFGIWFASKKRVAHTGLVERWGQYVVVTIEGNTVSDQGKGDEREGEGVYRKRRLVRQIYSVRNWL